MWSTVVFSILAGFTFIIFIILFVIVIKEEGLSGTFSDGGYLVAFGMLLLLTGVFILANVSCVQSGKLSQKDRESFIVNKQFLEDNLEKKDKYFFKYLDDAIKHNEIVNCNNDKFHRFSIEDRSEYLVDIEYYKSTLIMESE